MDNLYMDTHFFSVPVRLVWENWQQFMGETEPSDPVTTPPAAYAHNVEESAAGVRVVLTRKTSAEVYIEREPPTTVEYTPTSSADLSDATAATINELRLAFATQRFLEIQARGGTRYIEVIKAHFNVSSPDQRLQRSEYLGGGSSPINISPVARQEVK